MKGVVGLKSITKNLIFIIILLSTSEKVDAYISTILGYQQQQNEQIYFGKRSKKCRSGKLLFSSPTMNKYNIMLLNRSPSTLRTKAVATRLSMALIFAPLSDLSQCLVLGVPTGEQFSTYWGRTSRERVNAIFESCAVTFLGLFAAYFLSFVIGSSLATIFGMVAACWSLLGPQWKAYQRNWELVGGRRLVDPYYRQEDDDFDYIDDEEDEFSKDLYGAYYIASVKKVAVVESSLSPEEDEFDIRDFYDYTMEQDENEIATGIPWMLRLLVEDRSGRNMQVHARMSEDYVNIREGMPCASILLSTDRNFNVLSGLTDFYIPDARCCVGDYPYLDKLNFGRILEERGLLDVFDEEDQRLNTEENDEEEEEYDDAENWMEEEQVS